MITMLPKFMSFRKILCLVVLLSTFPGMAISLVNNITATFILPEWRGVIPKQGIPHCAVDVRSPAAEKFIRLAIALAPGDRSTLLNQGRIAWMKGDCVLAKESWEQVQKISPENISIPFWLFWLNGADPDKVISAQDVKRFAQYADRAGQAAENGGDLSAAISWYELSIDIAPGQNLVERFSSLYKKTARFEEARAYWDHVKVMLSPENPIHWWAQGQIAELNREWVLAAQAYKIGAGLSDTPFEYYIRQAEASKQFSDWSQVEQAYRDALAARPDVVWVYEEIGNVRFFLGKFDDALDWYRQAEKLSSNDPDVLYHLGETLYQQNMLSNAQMYMEKVLDLNPVHAKANYYMAQCLYMNDLKQKAVEHLAIAVEVSDTRPWQWAEQLGDWRLEIGDLQGALSAYRKALDWMPEDPEIKNKIKLLSKPGQ
jgi:tetratricopeptide (TPR) repeat protein